MRAGQSRTAPNAGLWGRAVRLFLEVIDVARPVHTVRGFSRNQTIPSSTPKFQGPNFGVAGWTVVHGRLWWAWHRTSQVVNSTQVPAWAGTIGFGLFETGSVIPGPESTPNAAGWVHWQPVTTLDEAHLDIWYDAGGTPASREWSFNGTYLEWETPRTAPGAGMDLWACWDIPVTPASTDRFSWAWVIQYLSL